MGKTGWFLGVGVALVAAGLAGCAPGFENSLQVSEVPEVTVTHLKPQGGGVLQVHIGEFTDNRREAAIAEVNGRQLMPEGQLGPVLQRAFERYFSLAGARLVLFKAPIIRGEITDWYVSVQPGFPMSHLHATAVVEATLLDLDGQVVYRATYSGESRGDELWVSSGTAEEYLGRAMSFAVQESLRDDALVRKLETY